MSVRILRDVEEAIAREIRRITFHENRTLDHVVLQDTFHPITGEVVKVPIEPNFYDSSADAQHIQYPHFFIKLLKMQEDLKTGRVTPQYGKQCGRPILTSPRGYQVVLYGQDGLINPAGNTITTGIFQIRKAEVGFLLRILSGNNIGTYTITGITVSNLGNHTITVSNDLVTNLPAIGFDLTNRIIGFTEIPDLNTVKVGDQFIDSTATAWSIIDIDINSSTIEIGGVGSPSLALGGKISRTGNVFQNTDLSAVKYTVMDPSKPVQISFGQEAYTNSQLYDHEIPLDIYYLIRIDSKERANHIDIANRMWEEFNPPRTSLPLIIRTKLSAEQKLTQDVTTGGSTTIYVADNSNFNVGENVFIFDDLHPTKNVYGDGFEEVFDANVVGKSGTNQLILSASVPDTYLVSNNTKVVSNANYVMVMFHFVNHVTKDVEEAQYWSHEFTFWIQVWIDRQGLPRDFDGTIQKIVTIQEDMDGNVIL